MSRGLQAAIAAVMIVIGAGAAFGYHGIKGGSTAATPTPNPTVSVSPAASPSPAPTPVASPSPSPAAAASPSAAPTAAPTATPAASAQPTAAPTSEPAAAYPAQIQPGFEVAYSGSGTVAALATDGRDVGGSVCAGINESTQAFPAGYDGNFFISITFPDGVTLSTGYIRTSTGRQDFAEYQVGSKQYGSATVATTPGSHTYCLTRGAANWTMSDDGKDIACGGCPAETAADTARATIKFQSTAANIDPSKPKSSFNLVVPGFHDLAVGGKPPTRLTGQVVTY